MEQPLRKIDACSNLVFKILMIYFIIQLKQILMEIYGFQVICILKLYQLKKLEEYSEGGFMMMLLLNYLLMEKFFLKNLFHKFYRKWFRVSLIFSWRCDFDNDPIHLNDIQPVNFDGEFWKKGDVFYP